MSTKPKIVIASDHAGFDLKEAVKRHLAGRAEVIDMGTNGSDSVDYPDFGYAAAKAIEEGRAREGIVICGSGIGISIAANRSKAVRAALCMTPEMARLSRQHNDANVLALGARLVDEKTAFECVDAFLSTDFEGGRHERRVGKLGDC